MMRLIDADALLDKQESLYMKGNVLFHGVTACAIENAPTIDTEALPIVKALREKLEQKEQELRSVKYCYDIAKNGERQLRRQVNEITAEWAECVKKLKLVTAERDAALADLKCIASCECCAYGCKNLEVDHCFDCGEKECRCRNCLSGDCWEWRGPVAENATAESEVRPNDRL